MSSAPSPAPPPSTAAWILEFILRQPIPDDLVHQILLALPLRFPLPSRLSKLILLRRLSTDLSRRSLSPRTLYSLELIHQLSHPLPPSAPMRRAYCAVAVHCTLRHRRKNFPAAVDTIWNRRIGDLQRSDATGLAGEDVLCWRSVLEEAVENEDLRRMLAERMTEEGALEAVRAYLKLEMDAMGPPFLQLAAEKFPSLGGGGEETVGLAMNVDGPLVNHHDIKGNENVTSVDMGGSFTCQKSRGRDIVHTKHSVVVQPYRSADLEPTDLTELVRNEAGMIANDPQQSIAQDKFRGHGAANGKTTHNQDRCSLSKLDSLPADEVRKVSEALKSSCAILAIAVETLKSSCANLATAVEDPLPNVLTTASLVIESRSGEARNADEPQESLDQVAGKGPLDLLDSPPADEVRKVSSALKSSCARLAIAVETLKSSCANLATAVEDPLPDVLTTASLVIESIESRSGEARNADEPQESLDQVDGKGPLDLANNIKESQVNHSRIVGNDPVSAVEMGTNVPHPESSAREIVCDIDSVAVQLSCHSDPGSSDLKELEENKDREAAEREQSVGEGTPRKGTGTILRGNKYCLLPQPSIMERNQTAHTFEWVEDSIDSPSESLPSPPKKRVLPSFQRRDVSSLMLPEIKVPNKQRKKRKWSLLEEDTLRQAVKKYGVGNWKYILSSYNEIFEDRTPGDLKDKWRNMTKH